MLTLRMTLLILIKRNIPTGDQRRRKEACIIIERDIYESHIGSLNLPEIQRGMMQRLPFLEGGVGNEGKEFK